jgi:hypothetical protein
MSVDLGIDLSAVIVTVEAATPLSLETRRSDQAPALPFGAFDPRADKTFELALRGWVAKQTGFPLGHVEQLYTFGDQNRGSLEDTEPLAAGSGADPERRQISVGYLALTPQKSHVDTAFEAAWRDWYAHFPWEDHRNGPPALIDRMIAPRLMTWAAGNDSRQQRTKLAFGLGDCQWLEERVLERYELLYEAGLVQEAARDAGLIAPADIFGQPMISDHRRILATAISRLRGKLKYRPVIFDLMPPKFTISMLQKTVEAILGLRLHTQNFRRALDRSGLVGGLGEMETSTGGRPAEYYRFRREVLGNRAQQGIATPIIKHPSTTG